MGSSVETVSKKLSMLGNKVIGHNEWAVVFENSNGRYKGVYNAEINSMIPEKFTSVTILKNFIVCSSGSQIPTVYSKSRNHNHLYVRNTTKDLLKRYKTAVSVVIPNDENARIIEVSRREIDKMTLISMTGKVKPFTIKGLCGLTQIRIMDDHKSNIVSIGLQNTMLTYSMDTRTFNTGDTTKLFDVDSDLNILKTYPY